MLRDFVLPPASVERAALAGSSPPPPVRDAATVMLIDDLPDGGVSVLAFRRRSTLAFAPGMLVFPGGAVDADDVRVAAEHGGPDAAGGGLDAVRVAAVRETFEECGVLLAAPAPGPTGAGSLEVGATDLARLRADLLAGRIDLAGVLRETGTRLRSDRLLPWAHWITPAFEPRRYDTRFFVAVVPEGQDPAEWGEEAEEGLIPGLEGGWLSAAEAVARHRAGGLAMLPPTLVCLEELAAAPSVAAVFATVRRPRPVTPWLAWTAGPGGRREQVLRVDLDGVGGGADGGEGEGEVGDG
ncbi:MAG: NUDIX hydrolase [Kineosporiaceae bacterium]|nr:NUDIX hydrolase [Kineosporiaceae bacterium]